MCGQIKVKRGLAVPTLHNHVDKLHVGAATVCYIYGTVTKYIRSNP